jgi:hypothetical protein
VSYARKGLPGEAGGSDVYVYATALPGEDGGRELICADCALLNVSHHHEDSAAGMVAHLLAHRDEGHNVPQSAIDRLLSETGGAS